MNTDSFMKNLDASITICDINGTITYMNDKAVKAHENNGGEKLIGTNIYDCHPEPSKSKLARLINNKETNCYTIEKNGIKKLIYQTPCFEGNEYVGYSEIVFQIPFDIPHFIRDKK
jgi:transcriptional regulator with PAS, ATPase and Fis domain